MHFKYQPWLLFLSHASHLTGKDFAGLRAARLSPHEPAPAPVTLDVRPKKSAALPLPCPGGPDFEGSCLPKPRENVTVQIHWPNPLAVAMDVAGCGMVPS